MTDFSGNAGSSSVSPTNVQSPGPLRRPPLAAGLVWRYRARFEEHVNELSQGLEQPPLVLPCDVTSDAEIDAVFAKIGQEFGGLDFVVHGAAFAPLTSSRRPLS